MYCQALCSASQQDGALSSEEGTKEWVIRNSLSAFFACRKGITRVKQIPLWGLIRGNYHFVGQKHQQLCMVSSIQNLHFLIALFLFSSWAEVISELFTMACKTAGSAPILISFAVPLQQAFPLVSTTGSLHQLFVCLKLSLRLLRGQFLFISEDSSFF